MTEIQRDLAGRRCEACETGAGALPEEEVRRLAAGLPGWHVEGGKSIARTWRFKDFHRTMAFVNAVAWISHQENHHPDLEVGYDRCTVRYTTHAAGTLTANDFICAAKVEALGA